MQSTLSFFSRVFSSPLASAKEETVPPVSEKNLEKDAALTQISYFNCRGSVFKTVNLFKQAPQAAHKAYVDQNPQFEKIFRSLLDIMRYICLQFQGFVRYAICENPHTASVETRIYRKGPQVDRLLSDMKQLETLFDQVRTTFLELEYTGKFNLIWPQVTEFTEQLTLLQASLKAYDIF
jgi:hypothetical protein